MDATLILNFPVMKQRYYILFLLLFGAAITLIFFRYQHKKEERENKVYSFIPRKGNANAAEYKMASTRAEKLILQLKSDPSNTKSALSLVNAYILESRQSGNYNYYDKAALVTVDKILASNPKEFEALLLKSLLQLSQHHFSEALQTANTALSINANNSFVYGLLTDANVELGDYASAVDAADKMVTARPDMRSYSRISYLREIHGDYPGAINAMQMAVDAGTPSEENTEWCRVQLARLYENIGDKAKALFTYQLSLAARPSYAPALVGMSNIMLFENKPDSAVYYLNAARENSNDIHIESSLAAAFEKAGQKDKSIALNKKVIEEMIRTSETDDENAGHYSDKELAYAYLQLNNYDKALSHALAEYNRRPANIDVNETVGWVYYKKKDFVNAKKYIDKSLVTKSKNPGLLCKAALIYSANGDTQKAKEFANTALQNKPLVQGEFMEDARKLFPSQSVTLAAIRK